MSEATQQDKPRGRRKVKSSIGRVPLKEEIESVFMHPQHSLKRNMAKSEFEVLDSIYSDNEVGQGSDEKAANSNSSNEFWALSHKEESLNKVRKSLLSMKFKWFTSGVMVASVLWFTYHQIDVHSLKANEDTKIVFQTAATIVTDKSFDNQVANNLGNQDIKLAKVSNGDKAGIPILSGLFTQNATQPTVKEKATDVAESNVTEATARENEITMHVIKNGDSLWLIAKEYYGDPTPENIRKIMEANKMQRASLYPGKKITIPL